MEKLHPDSWMTLDGLMLMAIQHWRNYRPRMTLQMIQDGTFMDRVFEAANATYRAIDSLNGKVIDLHQAWEMVREDYLLLRAENDWDSERNPAEKALQKMTLPWKKEVMAYLKTSPKAEAAGMAYGE